MSLNGSREMGHELGVICDSITFACLGLIVLPGRSIYPI